MRNGRKDSDSKLRYLLRAGDDSNEQLTTSSSLTSRRRADVTRPLDTQALHPPRRRDVTARVTSRRRADLTRPLDTQALQPPRRRDVTAAAANQRVSVGRALKPGVVR